MVDTAPSSWPWTCLVASTSSWCAASRLWDSMSLSISTTRAACAPWSGLSSTNARCWRSRSSSSIWFSTCRENCICRCSSAGVLRWFSFSRSRSSSSLLRRSRPRLSSSSSGPASPASATASAPASSSSRKLAGSVATSAVSGPFRRRRVRPDDFRPGSPASGEVPVLASRVVRRPARFGSRFRRTPVAFGFRPAPARLEAKMLMTLSASPMACWTPS